MSAPAANAPPRVDCRAASNGTACVTLTGDWTAQSPLPPIDPLREVLSANTGVKRLTFDATQLGTWSSGLVAFLLRCHELATARQVELDASALPEGVRKLLELATAVPEAAGARREPAQMHWVEALGRTSLAWRAAVRDTVAFIGECTLAAGRWLRGRAQLRRGDLLLLMQQSGAEALPIISLIAFLVGLILAFVGAVQLAQFGASIYVADLVSIAMVREMGCMMTAIVMCGRTGAAFAAQLGTMKVRQEIDALQLFGFSPLEFLVLPRLLALFLMIPLLTLYADLVGIAGGFLVASSMLQISFLEYWNQTLAALSLTQLSTGLVKSFVFGIIVAITGCLRGFQCGQDAAAVGAATTSAVVTAITWVIAADAVFAVLFNVLGI